MIDFNVNIEAETTLTYLFICFILYSVATFPTIKTILDYQSLEYEGISSIKKYFFFFLVCFILIIAPLNRGDFYHYCEYVQNYSPGSLFYMEEIYQDIVEFVDCNYLLFRIIVWGSATLLYLLTLKRLDINYHIGFFVLFSIYVNIFDYARASLGMAIYFFGLSYLIKPFDSKYSSYILGGIVIALSTIFHRSIVFLVAMTIMVFIPLNKKTVALTLFAFPLIAYFINYIFGSVLSLDFFSGEDGIAERAELYTLRESNAFNLLGLFREVWHYSLFYVPCLICVKTILSDYYESCPKELRLLAKVIVFSVFFASCLFFLDLNNKVMFYRTLYMTHIGLSLLLAGLFQYGLISRDTMKFLLLFCISDIVAYEFLYGFYVRLL